MTLFLVIFTIFVSLWPFLTYFTHEIHDTVVAIAYTPKNENVFGSI